MTERDPRIRAAMVELGTAAREAPAWEQITAASAARQAPEAAAVHRGLVGRLRRRQAGASVPVVRVGEVDMKETPRAATGRRGPLIAVAALTVALVIALPLWFVYRGEESPPVVTEPTVVTTVPASALEGIIIYVADGCADCSLLESTLRGLAGEVPVWVRPADGTMSLLPMVVVQFDGRVRGRWVGRGAVNSPEAIAAFAGARWPSGTMPPTTTTTTTTIPVTIVAAPVAAEDIAPCFPFCRLVAVSAGEVWASMASSDADLIGHLKDGVWAFYRFERPFGFLEPPGLAMAPDGTVWAATSQGVFTFEGGVGTRRFDHPAGGVAVAPDGTVWAGGIEQRGNGVWLARWDGESWVRVSGGQPMQGGIVPIAVSSDGAVWIGGYWVEPGLMRYDGATMEPVPVGDYQSGEYGVSVIEAAPNGDLWVAGSTSCDIACLPLLARFDGETWTTYDLWAGVAVGPDGLVWFTGGDGLVSFDGTDWTYHLQGQEVWAVDVAPDGTVWYMDEQGVHTLDTP